MQQINKYQSTTNRCTQTQSTAFKSWQRCNVYVYTVIPLILVALERWLPLSWRGNPLDDATPTFISDSGSPNIELPESEKSGCGIIT